MTDTHWEHIVGPSRWDISRNQLYSFSQMPFSNQLWGLVSPHPSDRSFLIVFGHFLDLKIPDYALSDNHMPLQAFLLRLPSLRRKLLGGGFLTTAYGLTSSRGSASGPWGAHFALLVPARADLAPTHPTRPVSCAAPSQGNQTANSLL